jgi:hypothetical protein
MWPLGFIGRPWFKYAALGAAVLALVIGGILYHRSVQDAARNEVVNDVQKKTIETLGAASAAKEKADAETRAKPYSERVEGLK